MRKRIDFLWQLWSRFWFEPKDLAPLACFRILFGTTVFLNYLLRQFEIHLFYSEQATARSHEALRIMPEFYRTPFAWFPTTEGSAYAWHLVYLLVILAFTLGIKSRFMAIAGVFLHAAFMQRNPSVAYGADIVASFFWFGAALTESDRHLSVRAWFRRRRGVAVVASPVSDLFTSVGIRLIQLQLCITYGYTGIEKLKGDTWWDGSAVWGVLANEQLMMLDLSWLQSFPLIVAAATYMTLIFEIYFPVLVWVRPLRPLLLLFGVALHLGIALMMGLVLFSGVMVASYVLFLDPVWLRRRLRRFTATNICL